MKKTIHLEFDLNKDIEKRAYETLKEYKNKCFTSWKGALCLYIANSGPFPEPVVIKPEEQKKSVLIGKEAPVPKKKETTSAQHTHTHEPVEPVNAPNEPEVGKTSRKVEEKNITQATQPINENDASPSIIEKIDKIDPKNRMKNMSDEETLRALLKSSVEMK